MKHIEQKEEAPEVLEVGQVFKHRNGEVYILMKIVNQYSLRSIGGLMRYSGEHSFIQDAFDGDRNLFTRLKGIQQFYCGD